MNNISYIDYINYLNEVEYLKRDDMFKLFKYSDFMKSKILFDYYLNNILNLYSHFGHWQSASDDYILYFKEIKKKLENKIYQDKIKNDYIRKKLIVKKFLQICIIFYQYKPGGSKYFECMERFNKIKN